LIITIWDARVWKGKVVKFIMSASIRCQPLMKDQSIQRTCKR